MGASPREAVCDPSGTTWEVAGLVVCDGSAFPSAPGVNPMISIETVAHMNASTLAARLS
jgi:choline dehydrogenase-like flavoprotein